MELFPDPTDCRSFFVCSNGVPIWVLCPDGLHFNDKLDVCDWPQNVPCEDGTGNGGGGGGGGGGTVKFGVEYHDCIYRVINGTYGQTVVIEVEGKRIELRIDANGCAEYVIEDRLKECLIGGNESYCKSQEDCPDGTFI